jgi:ABC-type phosphate transport system substrate-binding protein
MKPITLFSSLALAAMLALPAQAQVVILSTKNPISKLTKEQVSQIFLGQAKTFYTGGQAEPLDLPEGIDVRNAFYQKTLNKPSAQMKAFWSKMEFSGSAHAPKALSAAEVVKLVASNPKYIGYVDASAVTPEVKVVFTP